MSFLPRQVCGDGEYVIYTALAWRNKSFGQALEFVWGDDSNVFATRESASTSACLRRCCRTARLLLGYLLEDDCIQVGS